MSEILDLMRQVFTLVENVRSLKDDVNRLATKADDLRERVIRLETREEVLLEKTRNAAIMSVDKMSKDLLERLLRLEHAVANTAPSQRLLDDSTE